MDKEQIKAAIDLNKISNLLDWAKCGLNHNHPNKESLAHSIFNEELEYLKSMLNTEQSDAVGFKTWCDNILRKSLYYKGMDNNQLYMEFKNSNNLIK